MILQKEIQPTEHQQEVLKNCFSNLVSGNSCKLKGSAGVGKTQTARFIINALLDYYNWKHNHPSIFITAPTHKALKVLKGKINAHRNIEFRTTHSFLKLKMRTDKNGKKVFSQSFADAAKVPSGAIVLVDEASMVNTQLLQYLKNSGNAILYLYDDKQLNPVKEIGLPIEKYEIPTFTLTEIIRQSNGNDIIDLSMNIPLLANRVDGNNYKFGLPYKNQLEMLVDSNGTDKTKYLAYTNKVVDETNIIVRKAIYGDNCDTYENGETLMFKDMYKSFHTNQEALITDIDILTTKFSGMEFKCWVLTMAAKKVFAIHKDSFSDYKDHANKLASDAKKKRGTWKEYYTFVENFAKLSYNHAITVHKSQGSEYNNAIINVSTILKNPKREERRRLAYTAITRAKEMIYIV